MIVILCSSFYRAVEAYQEFLDFIEWFDPYLIKKNYPHSYCIETVEDLRYIFVDYRMEDLFIKMKADIVDEDEFFQDMDILYGYTHYKEELLKGE